MRMPGLWEAVSEGQAEGCRWRGSALPGPAGWKPAQSEGTNMALELPMGTGKRDMGTGGGQVMFPGPPQGAGGFHVCFR